MKSASPQNREAQSARAIGIAGGYPMVTGRRR
jgi:hypothetical protein